MRQKRDCQFRRRTCVALNSELIPLGWSASGDCFLKTVFSIWRTEILSDEGLKFCENLSANGTRGRNLIIQQYVFQYVQVAVGREWPRLFLFVWRDHIYACSSINIMYALVSTRQKFDVWIGAAFLSDNATRPVERAAEMRQPIQTSNFWQKCDVWTWP